mgnify:CR=1 FL=1
MPLAATSMAVTARPGSPAGIAGLQPNDTIVGFKGHAIASVDDLHKQLVANEIGQPSPLMFLRGTEKLFCMVVPREMPSVTPQTRRKSP